VYLTALIFVYSQRLRRISVENTTLARYKIFDILDIRLGEALVLCVDLQVVAYNTGRDFAMEARRLGS